MRIQHNIMAMSAYRNYTNNVSAMKKNLEKLSSGYKINRAGDDAAGLAISEKMRAQITGLETAQKNAKDGISLVQTAEGALTEVHDMLNRMVELATMSANGTYDSETDRAQLQKEMDQLRSEIDRISESSNFNGIKLLDGTMDAGGGTKQVSIVLPEDSKTQFGEIGDKTILKGSGAAAQKTEFAIQFDNLAIDAKTGDKLTVNVGGTDIEINLTEKKYTAADLAEELSKAFNGTTHKFGATGKEQEFDVSYTKGDTFVTFTQKADPTGADDTVEASMDVKMTYTPNGKTAMPLNDGIATHDGGYVVYATSVGEVTGTGKNDIELIAESSSGVGDAVTGTIAVGSGLVDALDGQSAADGDISVQYSNSQWTVSVGNDTTINATATYADGVLTLADDSGNELLTITASDASASGLAAATFQTALGNATATGLSYAAPKADGEGEGGEKPTSTPANIDIFDASDGIDVATDGDKTLGNLTSVKTAFGGLSDIQAGVNNEISVELSKLSFDDSDTLKAALKKVSDAISAAVTKWNTDNADKAYHYEYNGLSTDGTDGGKIDLQAATGITALINKVDGKANPPAASTGSGVSGSYNAATVKITQGNAVVADQRASTTINLGTIFGGDIGDGSKLKIGDETYTFKWGDSNSFSGNTITLDKNASKADRIAYAAKAMTNMSNSAFSIGNETTDGKITIDEKAGNTKFTTELSTHKGFESLFSATSVSASDPTKGLKLQIGDTADDYNQLRVSIGKTDCDALGIKTINIEDQDSAADAIKAIKTAINTVSDIRGTLGATQNRLDHTINNLSVMTENIQDAESTIRDVDVAEEMMAYTKNNILIQSAQAMLAQANQVPQGVLQLLQ